ncbi:hypothetical protein [Streptomyces scabiei]|uniref:hypothetical protein n=1 Tax=Streptomyces scabiei TaxID=1930 RepID=UPI0029B965A3|nr:hypothetical protein [Streptomyces scabiei]MDX3034170.1 hypothetical protein [Streptomyces scabiei]
MNRETRFLISRKPFAINLSTVTLEATERDGIYWLSGKCQAVWYRRKDGITRACIGTLGLWAQWLRNQPDLSSPEAMLSNNLDSRYGGDTEGRWDGTGYWGAEVPDTQEQHLAVLRPMLANYPTIPDGYDGWWTFQPAKTA